MKSFLAALLLGAAPLAAASPAPAPQSSSQRVSYDGYKVFRLPVGTDASKVAGIVDRLGLSTWKGAPRAGSFADVVVPPAQVDAFRGEIAGMEAVVTMHEDLGASIAEEASFQAYAGKYSRFKKGESGKGLHR